MSNPFDYLNAINHTKKDLMTDSANDELAESGYTAFVVNKGLSYFPDTVLYANEMNTKPQLDNKLQFHYLINSIRPKKRFSKWHKKGADNDLEVIQQYYQCGYSKAEQALKVLTVDQIECIKQKLQSCEE